MGGKTEIRGTLFTLEVAHSKLVVVAIDWQEGADWQTVNGRGWGHAQWSTGKGPRCGFKLTVEWRQQTGQTKGPLGLPRGLQLSGLVGACRGLLVLTVARKC
jgi:hypothetical protein